MRVPRTPLDDLPVTDPDFRFPLAEVPYPGDWTLRGACGPGERTGDDLIRHVAGFFPADTPADAALVACCAGCSVQAECLAFALRWPVRGIWGGLSERERAGIRRRRTDERRARARALRGAA